MRPVIPDYDWSIFGVRVTDAQKHELIRTLRLAHGKSLRETARLAGVSKMTIIRVCSKEEG